jgi:hypothetical protein
MRQSLRWLTEGVVQPPFERSAPSPRGARSTRWASAMALWRRRGIWLHQRLSDRCAAPLDEVCWGSRQFVTVDEGIELFVVEGDEAGDRRKLTHGVLVGPSDVRLNRVADSPGPVP